MTRDKVPNWQISGWLIDDCGLSFNESYKVRREANEEINNQITEQRRREEAFEKKDETRAGLPTIEFETFQEEAKEEIIKVEEEPCISCGDIEKICHCEVKTIDQIPF